METKTKNIHLELKAVAEDGTFEGYGNVFNEVDSYGDVVTKGAFARTLKNRNAPVKLLWQHKQEEVIGVFEDIAEDDHGLKVRGKLALGTQRGKEAYELIKMGALEGLSIGYTTIKEDFDAKKNIRYLKEVKLFEISIVTFPANEVSTITRVKSAFEDLNEEQRTAVLAYIHTLNQSPDVVADPPTEDIESEEKHSEPEQPDTSTTDAPVEESITELKHALEKLITALKQ